MVKVTPCARGDNPHKPGPARDGKQRKGNGMEERPDWAPWVALAALVFGLLTILSGGLALFGGRVAQQAAGNAVPFVLWFNFLAGGAYVAGAFGLHRWRHWAGTLAWTIGLATLAVFAAFGAAVAAGTAFETRTVYAMILRAGFWLAVGWAVWRARRQGPRSG